ncbi:MAG TPA: acetyltransferase [Syntrophobacteraceae bacterium]|nr:acetyltransferase [Syntrophobacteraceae bacterium]
MELYGIYGAGGFGREVMPVARQMLERLHGAENRGFELVFIDQTLGNRMIINGHRVMSQADFLSFEASSKFFNIAIADYSARERIAKEMMDAGVNPFTIRDFSSVIYDNNWLGEGAILCAFTTITSNARIGRFFHSNIYSYVAHDCIIGDFVTFAPSVHCNGRVIVEDYAYIGTGAVIRQGSDERPIVIGKGSIVGMGAVVTKSVEPFTVVFGNPAAAVRK